MAQFYSNLYVSKIVFNYEYISDAQPAPPLREPYKPARRKDD